MRTASLAAFLLFVGCSRHDTPPSGSLPGSASALPSAPASVVAPESAVVRCAGQSLAPRTDAELEALVSQRSPCAMSLLAARELARARRPAVFQHAAQLNREAFDAGADDASCDMLWRGIGQAPELTAAARCLARVQRWRELAVFYLNGWGVPRDVARARVILTRTRSAEPDMTDQQLAHAVDGAEAETTPPFRTWDWCKDIAATTLDMNQCLAVDRLASDWGASLAREKLLAALSPSAIPLFDALDAAHVAFFRAESDLVYYRHVDGTLRNAAAIAAEQQCKKHYDALLVALVRDRRLPAPTAEESTRLAAQLRKLDAELSPKEKGLQFDPAHYVAYRKARDAAWKRYVEAWAAFSRDVAPAVTPSELTFALLRDRVEATRAQSESH